MAGTWNWPKIAVSAAVAYTVALAGLLLLLLAVGDRTPVLFAANSLLLFGFLPMPLLLAVAVWRRHKPLIGGFGVLLLSWCWLWGGLFLPRGATSAAGPRLRVLTYNVLSVNFDVADTVALVRDSDADVVALHELNPETAAALERELGERYPHRWLEPAPGDDGGGFLSKHPFRPSIEQLGGKWLGRTNAIDVDVAGRPVTLLRFHAHSGPAELEQRDIQARALADYARRRRAPLVLLGDLNATDRNGAHAVITEHMRDAWREAGWGFGHTFPGRPTRREGGARPVVLGIPVPLWLVRIDYVFHSPEFVTESAEVTRAAEHSDHRGVVATLVLR